MTKTCLTRRHLAATVAAVAGVALAGCATVASDIDAASAPDGNTALLVGRFVLVHNGARVETSTLPHLVVGYVRPFTSVNELSRDPGLVGGSVAIPARLDQQGFIAIKLPPGRYYFDQFMYTSLSRMPVAFRTYAPLAGAKVGQRFAVTFEVMPGKATYIGTVLHQVQNEVVSGQPYWSFGYQIANEPARLESWASSRLPRWLPSLTTRLATMQPV